MDPRRDRAQHERPDHAAQQRRGAQRDERQEEHRRPGQGERIREPAGHHVGGARDDGEHRERSQGGGPLRDEQPERHGGRRARPGQPDAGLAPPGPDLDPARQEGEGRAQTPTDEGAGEPDREDKGEEQVHEAETAAPRTRRHLAPTAPVDEFTGSRGLWMVAPARAARSWSPHVFSAHAVGGWLYRAGTRGAPRRCRRASMRWRRGRGWPLFWSRCRRRRCRRGSCEPRARAFTDTTAGLSPEHTDRVVQVLLPEAPSLTAYGLRQCIEEWTSRTGTTHPRPPRPVVQHLPDPDPVPEDQHSRWRPVEYAADS